MLVYKVRLINLYKVWIIISIFHHYENNHIVLHHHVFSNCKEICTLMIYLKLCGFLNGTAVDMIGDVQDLVSVDVQRLF